MNPIRTDRLILRNWEDRDRDLFFRINSDPQVMEFFPFRRSRDETDAFFDRLRADIAGRGFGFTAVEIASSGEGIGFVGISATNLELLLPASPPQIAWRLAPEFWGNGYVTEAARAWLEFGFDSLEAPEIVSFAVHDNQRSIAVMQRLGMTRDAVGDFDHPDIPDTHPHLKRHALYRLSRTDWLAREKAAV